VNEPNDATRPEPPDSGTHTDATFVPPPDEQARLAAERGRVSVPGFVVEAVLGRGAYGVVYRACQDGLNRPVALKMLLGGPYAGETARARFLLEAEAVAALEHPHIVRVFQFGEAADHPYLAMELVPGGTLADRIKAGGPLPPPDAARVAAQLARAVAHAHSRGVVHRDIKPGNVLLAADGAPKLTDFGLAKVGRSDITMSGQVLGTPAYMSPEQAAGKVREVGTHSDVYALGAVLYDLLTGRPPFASDSKAVTLQKVMTEEPERPRRLNAAVPLDLETICLKCLEKSPDRRYPAAAALADELERFLAGRPILARPTGPAARAAKWVRRNPLPTAALALLCLAVASLTAAAWAQWRSAQLELAAAAAGRNETAERERRLGAERDVLHRERLRAIESSLRGARLKEGLTDLAAAEADGVPIPPEVRFLEVDALEAVGWLGDARQRLETATLQAEYAGRRDTRLADLSVGFDDARSRALFEAAAADPTRPEADRAFARAMLAPTINEALPVFRRALEAAPSFLPARRAYCLSLLCAGQLPDAVRAAEDGLLLYPEHPDFAWALLLSHAFAGDRDRAAAALARLKPLVRPELHPGLARVAELLPLLTVEFHAAVFGMPAPPAQFQLTAFMVADPLANDALGLAAGRPVQRRGDLQLRLPSPCRASLRAFWELIREAGLGRDVVVAIGRDDAATARMAAAVRDNPEGFMRFQYAMVLLTRAFEYQSRNPKDGDGFRERMAAAGAAFELASTSHGLVDVRLIALEKAVSCFSLAGKPGWAPEPRREWVVKGHDLLQRRLRMPEPVHPVNFETFVKSGRNFGNLSGDYTTARAVLRDWESRSPGDLGAARLRAEVEFNALVNAIDSHPALGAAERVLAQNPNDAGMRDIVEKYRKMFRLAPPALAPPPRPVE
jgi:tetratricopeptide (TPR) repeat protein